MDRFFDANNPVMKFLSRLVDMAVLNLMTIAGMIPIVTAGASITAMNNVLIHLVRKDETYVWKMFIASFRQNLKQGIGLGLLFTAIFAVAGLELMMLHSIDAKSSTMFMIIITVIGICVFGVGIYTFALLSRFENTVRGTLGQRGDSRSGAHSEDAGNAGSLRCLGSPPVANARNIPAGAAVRADDTGLPVRQDIRSDFQINGTE